MSGHRNWTLAEVAQTTMPSCRAELHRDQAALLERHEAYCWKRYGLEPRQPTARTDCPPDTAAALSTAPIAS